MAIADLQLVSEFDGVSGNFETWEKQIKLVKATYKLESDFAKILVGMKLKKKALEWFHSKPEHIEMTFDAHRRTEEDVLPSSEQDNDAKKV